MNTRLLMIASAAFLGVLGLGCTFAPVELLQALHAPADAPLPEMVQLLGAAAFGFALTNWTARGSIIGGIYARPLSIGNLVHFSCGAAALVREIARGGADPILLALAAGFALFALAFAYLVFGMGAGCIDRAT